MPRRHTRTYIRGTACNYLHTLCLPRRASIQGEFVSNRHETFSRYILRSSVREARERSSLLVERSDKLKEEEQNFPS